MIGFTSTESVAGHVELSPSIRRLRRTVKEETILKFEKLNVSVTFFWLYLTSALLPIWWWEMIKERGELLCEDTMLIVLSDNRSRNMGKFIFTIDIHTKSDWTTLHGRVPSVAVIEFVWCLSRHVLINTERLI